MQVDNCSKCDCGSKRIIVNKRHYLCQEKNRERLESQSGKKKEKIKSIKKTSEKQKSILIELKETYNQIAQEREHVCTGCGTTQALSHSHIIPRSRRKDLETVKENITYHCLIRCHNIWEHGTMEDKSKLLDFEENMKYIMETDQVYYNLLISKWQKEKK